MAEKETLKLIIDEEMRGTRLDLVLSLAFNEISRSFIQKLLEDGSVTVNEKVETSKKYKAKLNDIIEITLPEPKTLDVVPENIPLEIIYEDDDVLIVNKPRGMVVHPAPGNESGTLVNAILFHCGTRLSTINGVIRPGIVHRIDKDTSGLLMIAKNDNAHEKLSEQLEKHSITRKYEAVVFNSFKEDEGTINMPIGRDPNNRLRKKVMEGGKHAVTHYKVLERLGNFSLIEARLETGRTHQIRVHMSYINHPLVGDMVYGPKKQSFTEGQLLHAKTLGFVHPKTGEYMEFTVQRPEVFEKELIKLRNKGK